MDLNLIRGLVRKAGTRIILQVVDGMGGLPWKPGGLTELEAAETPNLDRLAAEGTCGLIEPVGPGITPGSGAGHLALFGYDPVQYAIGRGVLSALGVGFDLQPDDVAARGNFCTIDETGRVTDRRAGRIETELNERLSARLREIDLEDARALVEPEREHRFLLVLRGDGLSADVDDTDPQVEGVEPNPPTPRGPQADRTARLVERFAAAARERLADQPKANMILLRGFGRLPEWPRFPDVFGVRAAAFADYPMYRGVARLVGMEVPGNSPGLDGQLQAVKRHWDDFDFFFLHRKDADSAGEDGDFDRRVAVFEELDGFIPRLLDLEPDVLIITGDHSTPAALGQHSWHPVPALLWARTARPDGVAHFSERECRLGGLGARCPATALMPLALGHAMRLAKFGA